VSAEDQQEKFRLQDEIFALSGAYEALKTRLANLHPEYYRLKYAGTTVGISTIQAKLLKPDEILVEFFLGESALFTFVVSRDTAFMSRTMLPEGFQAAVLDFYDDIRNQRHDPAGYLIKASGFYKLLLEPIMPYVTGESLLIVPDGILSYLPFDALVEKPDPDISSYYQMEFLVQKYAIRYSYSCSLLEEVSQNRAAVRKNRYLAFAPDFGKTGTEKDPARADLPPLSGAMREIQLLSHHMKGSSYSGTAATETEFKRSGPQYSILHFATHALVDDAFPMNSRMLFARDAGSGEDGDLYAWELYNMKLHADLAVLSACNTGIGKLQRGEGVMSLGRAFFYSGVPAILMSLWPAQDQSTAEIMGVFYARLSKGATKPEALQAGKKAYLDSADELTSHPFYWAGFVMQGDPKPVAMGREFPGKWLLTAGLFLFFGLSWIYFRKKTSRKVKS
jgi:CHAT domain-containing protein